MAEPKKKTVRIAAVSDIHCDRRSQGALQPLFAQVAEQADVLLLPGDLTDYGLAEEAHILVKELTAAHNLPIIAVLGNHDFESGREQEIVQILCDAGVIMLGCGPDSVRFRPALTVGRADIDAAVDAVCDALTAVRRSSAF